MLALQRTAARAARASGADRLRSLTLKESPSKTQTRLVTSEIDSVKRDRERIVVLGSGWAGYTLARDIDKSKYQVVVVSPRSYFVFTPLLASTSVGTLEFRTVLEDVRSRRTNVDYLQGWADEVDFGRKTLIVEEAVENPHQVSALTEGREDASHVDKSDENQVRKEKKKKKKKGKMFEIGWDKLVISVGCYSQTFSTPGVKEHAYFLKDVADARKIRNRLLTCFEVAALPTTSETMKRHLLNFAVIGGGPTGIEWSAELHDIICEDMSKIYPGLMQFYQITIYDVAPQVLSMFDEKLTKYAMETFKRERINIKTSHHVEEVRRGVPKHVLEKGDVQEDMSCYTLKLTEEGEIGVGMVVWSTGLMMNPFISEALKNSFRLPTAGTETLLKGEDENTWVAERNPKSDALVTNDRLRLLLHPPGKDKAMGRAVLNEVYALGDCATIEDNMLPATGQVADQEAKWLAKRFNKRDIDANRFAYKDLGIMAYIGNWNAIMQSSGGDISGRFAWVIWRGAYLAKSVSWRNRILIPIYWLVNWVFGRDISRF